jgi:hypothetical protein
LLLYSDILHILLGELRLISLLCPATSLLLTCMQYRLREVDSSPSPPLTLLLTAHVCNLRRYILSRVSLSSVSIPGRRSGGGGGILAVRGLIGSNCPWSCSGVRGLILILVNPLWPFFPFRPASPSSFYAIFIFTFTVFSLFFFLFSIYPAAIFVFFQSSAFPGGFTPTDPVFDG